MVSDGSGKDDSDLPPDLRLLKGLVTGLTAVMILGVIAVVAVLVIRLPAQAVTVPDLDLPPGTDVHAVTQAPDLWLVTTADGRLLVFAPDGSLRGTMDLP